MFGLMPLRMGAAMAAGPGPHRAVPRGDGPLRGRVVRGDPPHARDRRPHGARRRQADVLRLVVREGMRLTLIGIGSASSRARPRAGAVECALRRASVDAGVFAGVTALLLGVSAASRATCPRAARRAWIRLSRCGPSEHHLATRDSGCGRSCGPALSRAQVRPVRRDAPVR